MLKAIIDLASAQISPYLWPQSPDLVPQAG